MEETRRMAIQMACVHLVAQYAQKVDQPDPQAFCELFAPDGEWIRPGAHMRGREEIRQFMLSRPPRDLTRHVSGSVVIDVVDEEHAHGASYATVFADRNYPGSGTARLGQPELVVDYRDAYVRIGGHWYIAQRQTTVVFSANA